MSQGLKPKKRREHLVIKTQIGPLGSQSCIPDISDHLIVENYDCFFAT